MRKLILAAVAGTAFALAGCSEKAPEATATAADAMASDTGMASDAAMASDTGMASEGAMAPAAK